MCIRIVFVLSLWANFGKCVYFENSSLGHVVSIQSNRAQLWNDTNQDKLKKDLFMNYDRFSRPTEHFNFTKVSIGIAFIHVEADERKSIVNVHGWLRLIWNDPKLSWREEEYGNISVLRIADHEIWHPDLYLYNSAVGGEPLFRFGAPNALIYPSGEVLFVPPLKQTVLCKFDLRYWPFDEQHCELKYGSWVHHANEIKLGLYSNEPHVDLSDIFLDTTWNITDTFAKVAMNRYECCPELYYDVTFTFTMVRNYATYITVVVTPCIVNTLMIIIQFWLPHDSKQRLYLNGYLLITLSCYLLYFMNLLSGVGSSTPIIVQFYANSLAVVCLGLTVNAAAVVILKSKKLKMIETYVQKVFAGRASKLFCVSSYIVQPSNDKKLVASGSSEIENEEARLCDSVSPNTPCFITLVNRLMFIIYVIVACVVGLQLHYY